MNYCDCGKRQNWHGDHGWICPTCNADKFPGCFVCGRGQPLGLEHVHAAAEVSTIRDRKLSHVDNTVRMAASGRFA